MRAPSGTFDTQVAAIGSIEDPAIATLVHAAADIALVVDSAGVIRALSFGPGVRPIEGWRGWLGREWAATVSAESEPLVREMLREAGGAGVSASRQVTHPAGGGPGVPVAYTAVRLGSGDEVVAIGRDLSALAELRRQLSEAQQAIERDYRRLRQLETRHRLLSQLCSEAVLLLDGVTLRVLDANPAAGRLFGCAAKRLVGRTFPAGFDRPSERVLKDLVNATRSSGGTGETPARLGSSRRRVLVTVSLIRQEASSVFLVRMLPKRADPAAPPSGGPASSVSSLARVLEHAPDALVLTDGDGAVVTANRAFLDLVQVASADQVRGRPLGRWLGRPGADAPLLLSTLERHGTARLFATTVRGELGSAVEVEASGVLVTSGAEPRAGLVLRDVGQRLGIRPDGAGDLTQAVQQLTTLVGRVALRDLVRDTGDLLERHFVDAALGLTRGNRSSAAKLLGISRQSLYVKLRRYQLGGDSTPVR